MLVIHPRTLEASSVLARKDGPEQREAGSWIQLCPIPPMESDKRPNSAIVLIYWSTAWSRRSASTGQPDLARDTHMIQRQSGVCASKTTEWGRHHPPSKCIILFPGQACFPDPVEVVPSQPATSLRLSAYHGVHEVSLFYFLIGVI